MKHYAICCALLLGFWGCSNESANVSTDAAPPFEEIMKIDIHAHVFQDMDGLPALLEQNKLRITNVCVMGTDPAQMQQMEAGAEMLLQAYGKLFPFASTFDVSKRNDPDYHQQVISWLDKTFDAGAIMVKIWKEVGMQIKSPDGTFIMPDDVLFDPIYDHLEKRSIPLLAHLAEPKAAWMPLDPASPHYPYYSKNPEFHMYGKTEYPSWDEIIAARDNVLKKHPGLTFIGAHMGSMAYDVDVVADRLDKYPNFYAECSARTKDMSLQSADKVRKFMIKYQDRVLYGTDIVKFPGRDDADMPPDQRIPDALAVIDVYRRDYQYYAGTGAMEFNGNQVDCLGLPKDVLEKFYSKNALRLVPGLSE
jgi:predicted TIM-barrel fold metal-dependent hydrolase